MADDRTFYLSLAFIILLGSLPLLVRLALSLTSPWRSVAELYPGPGPEEAEQVSYVMARFRGKSFPFSLTRSIRIRTTASSLTLSVVGFDFMPVALPVIVIPASAITLCSDCDFIVPRQRILVEGSPVRIVIYGRGARFVRAWWQSREGGQRAAR